MKSFKQVAALAAILLLPVMASAEWERTIGAWDTRLPAKGKFHAAVWNNYSKDKVANADVSSNLTNLDMIYGISDNWSAYVSPSFSSWKVDGGGSEAGISDTMLQTTYRFRDEAADKFDLAVTGKLRVPTGDEDKNLSGGKYEPGARLLAAKTFGSVVAVANLGLTAVLDADKGEKSFVTDYTLEGVYPLNDKLNLNLSAYSETARVDGGNMDTDLGIGTRYSVKDQLYAAAMLYKDLTKSSAWGLQLAVGVQF